MKLYKCEMCGKKVLQVQDHHVIPWYLSHDDSESNIMRLCHSCHGKADTIFDNLILRGKMIVSEDTRKRVVCRYAKRYIKKKQLYSLTLLKYTRYYDRVLYNIKTGNIRIIHIWSYFPKKYSCVGSSINIHRRSKKAATLKGQTTLDVGGIK